MIIFKDVEKEIMNKLQQSILQIVGMQNLGKIEILK